jgi:YfiH family protein
MTITLPSLCALSGIRHAFFTRDGGVSSGIYTSLNGGIASKDEPAHVVENRARMARTLGVTPENLVTAYQIHSPDVVVAEKPWGAGARPKADAAVTRVVGLAIGVTTADCGPVLFADEKARVIGAAHAGWRGAFSGVIEATLDAMDRLGARRANIVTALGPMIRQPNYEVGGEFFRTFTTADGNNERFFKNGVRPDHYLFDLAAYIATRLTTAGVRAIEDCGLCTYAEPDRFYSYRRSQHRNEPDYGRHVNAIVLSD